MKTLSLEDYQKAGETFWPKYWYIAKELGEDARTEDILKVMEAVGGVALKLALTRHDRVASHEPQMTSKGMGVLGINSLMEQEAA